MRTRQDKPASGVLCATGLQKGGQVIGSTRELDVSQQCFTLLFGQVANLFEATESFSTHNILI